jgi:hypothetical protein
VGEDPQDDFARLRGTAASAQSRAEASLVLAKAALGMPALMVQRTREVPSHGAPVGRLRPAPAGIPRVERDDAAPHSALLAAETVIMLGVIGRIGQRSLERKEGSRLTHCRGEVGRVLARSDAGNRAEDQVRMGVDDRGELRPGSLAMSRAPAAQAEVGADMPSLEPGRIHGRHRCSIDQARCMGTGDDRGLSAPEGPPFSAPASSRCAA